MRELRVSAGLNQTELARRLGRPQSYVSRYEAGQTRLDLPELRRVCEVFGIKLGDFISRFESTNEA